MTGQYNLYPKAEADLEDIWFYTVQEWSIEQAIKYIDDLGNAFQLLADSPLLCRERNELTPPVRIHHFKYHLIVYISRPDSIDIVRVLHENMDYKAQLSEGNA